MSDLKDGKWDAKLLVLYALESMTFPTEQQEMVYGIDLVEAFNKYQNI